VNTTVEARFPLLRGLTLAVPVPWQLPTVYGSVFGDAARVWTPFDRSQFGVVGWSAYLGGGFMPAIRYNWFWYTTDFERFATAVPGHYFSIAYNF
jgi:hypothetical protein